MNGRHRAVAIAGSVCLLATACSSSGHRKVAQGPPSGATSSAPSTTVPYHPVIDPAKFSAAVTNSYYPLKPGTSTTFDGTRDGAPEHVEVVVAKQTKTILGVKCVVISDVVTSNQTLVEKTTDWYTQEQSGAVWYFGEDSAEYANGVVTSTHGSWEAGVDGAQPGIIMQATPRVGVAYRQEFRPTVAEDKARVTDTSAVLTVPAGTFHNVVVTLDLDPLDPSKIEHKWYAKGVGLIKAIRKSGGHTEVITLTKIVRS